MNVAEQLGAGGRLAIMGARLEGDINGALRQKVTVRISYRVDGILCVKLNKRKIINTNYKT